MRLIEILVLPTQSGTEVSFEKQTSKYFAQEETLRLKRIAAASEKPHDTPSYSSTTVTAVSGFVTLVQTLFLLASPSQICLYRLDPRQRCYQQPTSTRP